jgi:hypothetical protein
MKTGRAAAEQAQAMGSVMNFRIEYFRDGILIKACPSHRSREEAIESARLGLAAHKAQQAIIRDCDAANAEVARVNR